MTDVVYRPLLTVLGYYFGLGVQGGWFSTEGLSLLGHCGKVTLSARAPEVGMGSGTTRVGNAIAVASAGGDGGGRRLGGSGGGGWWW